MEIKRKYNKGYKPKIYLTECSLSCENKRSKVINLKRQVLVLNDNSEILTEKMNKYYVNRIWKGEKIAGKLSDHNVKIINIKIISEHGQINYDFDEFKH